MALTDCP